MYRIILSASPVETNRYGLVAKKAQAEAAAARQMEQEAIRVQQAEAADRFRGTHLAPNVHHWDEVRQCAV